MDLIGFLFRWSHFLFGITWIGMLYYFNFIQGGYFKQASAEGLADAKAKLAPSALWWFRWGAMGTFITGLALLGKLAIGLNNYIIVGAVFGTIMFLNVWLIIWPNQKIALGMAEGDAPAAGAKALLASRHNVLYSAPMVFCMLASGHPDPSLGWSLYSSMSNSLIVMLVIIAALQANAMFGKQGPLTTVKGVIHASLGLTAVMVLVFNYV
jgi:uncharacterized membrane protein